MSKVALKDQLFLEILRARQRVYEVSGVTPLQEIELDNGCRIFLKREDLSPIHAYKWRGAYYRMAILSDEEKSRGVICASAGNHAQGVALAAARMGISAKIFMPFSTPRMKTQSVARHGGEHVEIILFGDTFDDARQESLSVADAEHRVYIHPYDDIHTMGGQGTIGDEIVMSAKGPFDEAFLQIGGGGMAAAVSCWLKYYYPTMKITGVEGKQQASMAAAFAAGKPVSIQDLDVFSDGTAVRQAGSLTYPICREFLDELTTVTNEELCAAIQFLWEKLRVIPEPAGAMGLAAILKNQDALAGKRVLAVLCGANMDFGQLAWISRHAGIGSHRRRYYRFGIPERPGSMLKLVEEVLEGANIIEFQFGKVHNDNAHPVIGFEATPIELHAIEQRLRACNITFSDVTSKEDVEFRIIPYDPELFTHPWFIRFDFPERAGALRDFLRNAGDYANLCYFNYVYTGERVGRAMLGFEFESINRREEFQHYLKNSRWKWHEISNNVVDRIIG